MIYESGPAYKWKIAIVSFRQNMVGERVANVLSRRQGICPGVELLPDILAGPDRPSGASGRHDSRNRSWSWRRPATTTLDESTSARMAMMTCSGREAQASQRRASLERNRSAVGKTANSLVYPRRQQLTPLPCGGPARLDPSLEPTRSAVLISGLATGPPAGVGGGLRFPLLACNRSILFPKRAPYPAIQSLRSKRRAHRGFVQGDCIRRADTAWNEADARPAHRIQPSSLRWFGRSPDPPLRPQVSQSPTVGASPGDPLWAERQGLETLAERNKFATTAVGIKGRSRPT